MFKDTFILDKWQVAFYEELEKIFMLIKTLEDLVVKSEAQIKGLNPKYLSLYRKSPSS